MGYYHCAEEYDVGTAMIGHDAATEFAVATCIIDANLFLPESSFIYGLSYNISSNESLMVSMIS